MRSALAAHGLTAVTLFAQNDGTLMSLDQALRYPVLTIGSGPANSVRGAAFLTGAADSLVADVGGTSTDIGVLANGFPRESSYGVEIGGIRTNFRMPDLVTIALGGGTVVSRAATGPASARAASGTCSSGKRSSSAAARRRSPTPRSRPAGPGWGTRVAPAGTGSCSPRRWRRPTRCSPTRSTG